MAGQAPRQCRATRYSSAQCSETPPKFEVVYFNTKGGELDSHPACFTHGLAEVERHTASAGIARIELREQRTIVPTKTDERRPT